ncbi:MAG: RNA polymerase sigma-70 factor [Bacteroidales bacterium]|nr:RNA polymerase sigma-70 factor [Bacteroidales bacterium]
MKDQLALRIRLGDEQAFELLFRKYYVRLCGFANKFLNNPEEAREIIQEVFIKIWEGREEIDPEDSLKSYLFKIAQNQSLNRLRKLKVESKYKEIYKLVYIEHSEFSSYESLMVRELDKNIITALNTIPPKCKRIFELSRNEGLKYSEIAEVMNISVKTVEAQMSKALNILRFELKDYLEVLIVVLILADL